MKLIARALHRLAWRLDPPPRMTVVMTLPSGRDIGRVVARAVQNERGLR